MFLVILYRNSLTEVFGWMGLARAVVLLTYPYLHPSPFGLLRGSQEAASSTKPHPLVLAILKVGEGRVEEGRRSTVVSFEIWKSVSLRNQCQKYDDSKWRRVVRRSLRSSVRAGFAPPHSV
jgi:hypothetical protein